MDHGPGPFLCLLLSGHHRVIFAPLYLSAMMVYLSVLLQAQKPVPVHLIATYDLDMKFALGTLAGPMGTISPIYPIDSIGV